MPNSRTDTTEFDKWLDAQPAFSLPMVNWGPSHSEIAVKFARDMANAAVRQVLDQALNEGDGSYRP